MRTKKNFQLLNHEVIKPTGTVHIQHKLSLLEQQIWNILFKNAYYDLNKKDVFQIKTSKLKKYFSYGLKNTKHLKECLKLLVETSVEFNIFNKDKKVWGVFGLLAGAVIKDGICSYSYSRELQELMQNPLMFTKVNLLIEQNFTSKYSLFIYELCLDYHGIKQSPMMPLDKFKDYLGLKKTQYPLFKDINKHILKPSIKEINKTTDLFIELEKGKEGRKVVGVKFHITKNPNQPRSTRQDSLFLLEQNPELFKNFPEPRLEAQLPKILNKAKKKLYNSAQREIIREINNLEIFEFSADIIRKIVEDYPVKKIKLAIEDIKDKLKKKAKITNPSGYLLELLNKEEFGKHQEKIAKKKEKVKLKNQKREEAMQKADERKKREEVKRKEEALEWIKVNPDKYDQLAKEYLKNSPFMYVTISEYAQKYFNKEKITKKELLIFLKEDRTYGFNGKILKKIYDEYIDPKSN